MKQLLQTIKDFSQSKQAKRFYWNTLNGFIGVLVSYLSYLAGLNIQWAIMIMPLITSMANSITKEINNRAQGK